MAYISQERKAEIQKLLKPVLDKYSVKATLKVDHHTSLMMTVRKGRIDFLGDLTERGAEVRPRRNPDSYYLGVNHYWYHQHFKGKALEFLSEAIPILNTGNHDNSDIQSDYFDVGWYIDVSIGQWNKPYVLIK